MTQSDKWKGLIRSLPLGIYAASSILLIAVFKATTGIGNDWNLLNEELEIVLRFIWVPILGILLPITISKTIIVGEKYSNVLFSLFTFFIVLVVGSAMLFAIGATLPDWWPFYQGIGVVSIICTFAMATDIVFRDEKSKHNDFKPKNEQSYEGFARQLELDHDNLKTMTQTIFTMLGVFFISGVIAVTFNEKILEQLGTSNLNITAFIVMTSSFWGLAGIWFGIIGPILGQMSYIRDEIRKAYNGKVDSSNSRPKT